MKYAVWRQVVVHGLDPYAGYLHVDVWEASCWAGGVQAARRPPGSQARRRLGGWRLAREARARIVQRWAELKLEPAVARRVAAAVAHLEGRATRCYDLGRGLRHIRRRREGLGRLCDLGVGLREGAEDYVGRLQRAADLAAVLAKGVKTGHVALIPVTEELLWGAL
ncbi:MAG: hypothetical protein ACO2PN_00420 [Pyrobaculum sp.]